MAISMSISAFSSGLAASASAACSAASNCDVARLCAILFFSRFMRDKARQHAPMRPACFHSVKLVCIASSVRRDAGEDECGHVLVPAHRDTARREVFGEAVDAEELLRVDH